MISALLFPQFPRGVLSVKGTDRTKFLHNLLTHDIKGLEAQQGRHACLLDRQGKIRFSAIIHAQSNELLIELDPSELSLALEALRQYLISEAVELTDVTKKYSIIPLHGPGSEEILKKSGFQKLPTTSLNHEEGLPNSGIVWIERWDLFQSAGYHLWVNPEQESEIREQLLAVGKNYSMETGTAKTFDLLRIESGVPWAGAEINETVILNELGNDNWMSFTKGCYVGQEIVARIKYRAHPPRLLKGFFIEGTDIPPSKSPIELDEKTVGVITSTCFSPTLNRVIALGFLNYGITSTNLLVKLPTGSIRITPTELPFIDGG